MMWTVIAGFALVIAAAAGAFFMALWGYILADEPPGTPGAWKVAVVGGACILTSVVLGIIV